MSTQRSKLEVVYRFFTGTGVSYDRVVNLCTCGFDRSWKKRILAAIPPNPKHILDQACGTGILTLAIARAFPDSQVTGVELREEYLAIARHKAHAEGLGNVRFRLGRAEEVLLEERIDCITSSYLAKYADLQPLLRNADTMLRPGGRIILHDFTYPQNRRFLLLWRIWFALLQTIGGRIFPEWRIVFQELPAFLQATRWLPETLALLQALGFAKLTRQELTFGTSAIVTADKPGGSLLTSS